MVKRNNTVPMRVDPALREFLKEICGNRYKNGRDMELRKPPRLSLAITRVPNLKKILEEARIDD